MGRILLVVAGLGLAAMTLSAGFVLAVYGFMAAMEYVGGKVGLVIGSVLLVLSPLGWVVVQEYVWMRRDAS